LIARLIMVSDVEPGRPPNHPIPDSLHVIGL
jgi:hypothetical protein